MFLMTADILIGPYKPLKPSSFSCKRSVENFTDTAKIKLPAVSMLRKAGDQYDKVQTGLQFTEGMKVEIRSGYDGRNKTVFKGFLSRRNFTVPLELECEGYCYQLRKKLGINKSYKNTTAKAILTDLVQDTDIKLSAEIPNIPIDKVVFENVSGVQVLEWFKEKCLLTVYFIFDTLYVGLFEVQPTSIVKFRLGWNTAKDSDLKFDNEKEFAEVRINVQRRDKTGAKKGKFVGAKDGNVKRIKTAISDPETMAKIAEEQKKKLVNKGYEGSITAFLEPYVEPGSGISIEDTKYPERTGRYFVTEVETDFGTGGGRQKIKIGNSI